MNGPALIAAAGCTLFLAIAGLLAVEAYLLVRGQPPITFYTRQAVAHWPGATLAAMGVVVFGIGAVFAHFVWDTGCF